MKGPEQKTVGHFRSHRSGHVSEQILEVISQLSYASTLPEVTEVVRRAVRQLTGADGATFILREGNLVHYVDEDAIGPLWKGNRFDIQACISGWSILNRKAAAIEDIYSDPRIPVEAYRSTFVKSLIMVPIRSEDPIGAIGAYWAKRRKPSRRQIEILQSLADAAALAFANARHLQGYDGTDVQGFSKSMSGGSGSQRSDKSLLANESFDRLILIGASAGGVSTLMNLLAQLPSDLAAPIFLVIHTSQDGASDLQVVLNRVSALPVSCAQEGEPIRPGRVYLPPADHHLLVDRGFVRVFKGPEENFTRPAIDPLFRTAAIHYRHRVVGIILSGNLYDGTAGLLCVKMHGGTTIVQNPEETVFPYMCRTAMKYVNIDYIFTLSEIARYLSRLASSQIVRRS
ncbi:MAG TPA: chemotaxis protein CheB [Thermodesulfobacteriota bacterium]|nr:chemotaxis protein CheB [Thermodesulfobacteriota bacterium]